ncbi:hypothetical protein SAMN05660831_02498 [Thiohalospira halophila DSM 15071]|uniref:Uncharacterized protein n=1 Tax=Thiohalospira halophila DSM 15071 TaxID=1123397 RepID=A0A1I1VVA7_9GAMM|nr:hypothetical protein [Thiohalospira halophila]SFD86669.1 hypothetical protein SAMN05660831_02498 [Thiohalospira halophila DSM 15071]
MRRNTTMPRTLTVWLMALLLAWPLVTAAVVLVDELLGDGLFRYRLFHTGWKGLLAELATDYLRSLPWLAGLQLLHAALFAWLAPLPSLFLVLVAAAATGWGLGGVAAAMALLGLSLVMVLLTRVGGLVPGVRG